MPKLIHPSEKRIKTVVEEAKTLEEAALILGCTRSGLGVHLARLHAEWWAGLKKRRRVGNATARRRRHRHKTEARVLVARLGAGEVAWAALTWRQQRLVAAHAPTGWTPDTG